MYAVCPEISFAKSRYESVRVLLLFAFSVDVVVVSCSESVIVEASEELVC
jgi:hypothetical protein